MFDLSAVTAAVWIPVYFPALKPGDTEEADAQMVEHRIDVQVELMDMNDVDRWFMFDLGEDGKLMGRDGKVIMDGDKPAEEPTDHARFMRVVRNWRKVTSKGASVPFTAENAAIILGVPTFPIAFGKAYLQAIAGKVETREKNSAGSPADGPAGDL